MSSRRRFLQNGSVGFLSSFILPLSSFANDASGFNGMVVGDDEGEAIQLHEGATIVKIKIAKAHGAESFSFLSETFKPDDILPIHKHLNEDEIIFLYKGSGLLTLGDNEYHIKEGAVAFVPRGTWHGLQNTGDANIEMRFGYTPAGFEGYYREVGTPVGQAFIQRTMDEKLDIGRKWGMIYKR
jgi:quercetin dioxygenase-like cupin family protein